MLTPNDFHEYQPLGIDHVMKHPRGALFLPMGFGKCVITLTALDRLSFVEEVFPALVLATPRVASETWPEEVAKWTHLEHLTISAAIGNADERSAALRRPADIYTINYENIPWLCKFFGPRWPFKTVVADESTRLKSFRLRQGGSRARALSKVAFHPNTTRFLDLTGTPSPNGLIDLWGQVWFLDQGERLGRSFRSFSERWFKTDYNGFNLSPLPHAQKEIEEVLKDICLSLKVEDHFDLKEPIANVVEVNLPPLARSKYKEMEKAFFTRLQQHEVEAFNAAVKTGKLLQLANGAAYVGEDSKEWVEVHDVKLKALEEIMESAQGMPVLVAYHHRCDRERLSKHFPKAVDLADKAGLAAFKKGTARIGIGHPASVGHGIDGIQRVTNTIVFFGLNWSLEEHMQMIERIGPVRQRQAGFNRPVYVYYIIAKDTIDETVLDRLKSKRNVQELLLEAMSRRDYGG